MNVLHRKALRDLLAARAMLASVLLVVSIGVACFVGMASMWVNLERARREHDAACRLADFWVELRRAPVTEIERLTDIPGVVEVHPRIVARATVDLPDVDDPVVAQVVSLPDHERAPINGVVLRRGSMLSGPHLEEALVSEAFAHARGIDPGQTISVVLERRRHDLLVVGTVVAAEFAYMLQPGGLIPDPERFGVLYVKERFAEQALDMEGACNEVVGLLDAAAAAAPERALRAIEHRLEPYGVVASTPRSLQSSSQILDDELAQLRATAVVLPAFFLGVAALILNILMSRLVEQQRGVIGTLKALGYGGRTLLRHYLGIGAIVGVAGGLVGLGLGQFLGDGMAVLYRRYFEFPTLENRAVPAVLAIGLVMSVAFALLGAARGALAVLRLSPALAMRPAPPPYAGPTALERLGPLWQRLHWSSRMVLRRIWRNRVRTVAGISAAALGASILFVTFFFLESIDAMIDFQFAQVQRSDLDVVLKDKRGVEAVDEGRRLPGVTNVEGVLVVPCELRFGHREKRTAVLGVADGGQLTVPSTADGRRLPVPETGLLLSRALADRLGAAPGDRLVLRPIEGRREPVEVAVAGISDGYVGMVTYADRRWLSRLAGESDAVSLLQFQSSRAAGDRAALLRELKAMPSVEAVRDIERSRAQLESLLLESLRYSVSVLIGLSGVIFLGSILTTSLVALSERRREIATLRVVGYDSADVGRMFLHESLLVNVAGAVAGIPLGRWLGVWLLESHAREAYRFPVVDGTASAIGTVALAALFALGAHVIVQRAINRLAWRRAINVME